MRIPMLPAAVVLAVACAPWAVPVSHGQAARKSAAPAPTAPAPAPAGPAAASAQPPVKVVYHLTGGIDEAQRAISNIRNHMAADPQAKIIVVANGPGIDFMLDGAKDRNRSPFDATIQDLKSKGVDFRLCQYTLIRRKIDRSAVVMDVEIVQSGVAEAARLQFREGYAYLRP